MNGYSQFSVFFHAQLYILSPLSLASVNDFKTLAVSSVPIVVIDEGCVGRAVELWDTKQVWDLPALSVV